MPDCTCKDCVAACRRIPGLFTPVDAWRAIKAGHAERMMKVWVWPFMGDEDDGWYVMSPLSVRGTPSGEPDWPSYRWSLHDRDCALGAHGRCVFLKRNRCELHRTDFKPSECRYTMICQVEDQRKVGHPDYRGRWNNWLGRYVVSHWSAIVKETTNDRT